MTSGDTAHLRSDLRDAGRARAEAQRRLTEAELRLGRTAHEAIRAGMRVSEVGELVGLDRAQVYESLLRVGRTGV